MAYTVLEPRGWERSAWGQPDSEDVEFRTKGWGDPLTLFTDDDSPVGTGYEQREPTGAGMVGAGGEDEDDEFKRFAGEPLTEYTDDEDD